MTREDAIHFANCLKNNYTIDLNDMQAFCDEAIKALEQEPVIDKIRAEIEQEIIPRNSDQYDHEAMWQNLGLRMALKAIDKCKAESEK